MILHRLLSYPKLCDKGEPYLTPWMPLNPVPSHLHLAGSQRVVLDYSNILLTLLLYSLSWSICCLMSFTGLCVYTQMHVHENTRLEPVPTSDLSFHWSHLLAFNYFAFTATPLPVCSAWWYSINTCWLAFLGEILKVPDTQKDAQPFRKDAGHKHSIKPYLAILGQYYPCIYEECLYLIKGLGCPAYQN